MILIYSLKSLFNFISKINIIALAIWFVRWYIKGHTGKYAIFFWIYTLYVCFMYYNIETNKPIEDTTPGYVYWERNVKLD